ncbi:MAG: RNA 2',3'-cyclic phosphodiesterase [Nitrosopumilus sp.]|nr:RNA 2',3'-cyclic phosphodiesterase [Nitrosopumilus sp.]NNL58617.1 RNA 2',3'-cyclic phosphodiesterase [Nitrosopumilus sp.]
MRTFVAVEISNISVIKEIEKFQSQRNFNAKAVETKNLHFTLQFVGEISDDDSQKIISALKKIEFTGFEVNLEGIGAFPKPKFPRVIWIGTDSQGGDSLIKLSKLVQNALEPLGYNQDKPFKPHLTVFRIKKKIGDITEELEKQKSLNFGIQEVTSLKFKKSELTPNGPIYSDITEIKCI